MEIVTLGKGIPALLGRLETVGSRRLYPRESHLHDRSLHLHPLSELLNTLKLGRTAKEAEAEKAVRELVERAQQKYQGELNIVDELDQVRALPD
ncbi:MAG: hypothetical protein DRN99_06565 [Thermoproteota archaeon]|nr:MAG: hypothetical protein DRN99_06565 [Candidatus Korarchaeota archaeon]